MRESLARALQLEGYLVATTTNGNDALEAIHGAQPDVLLLDVSMRAVDGLTVCRVLRAEQNRLPILMMTARTETSDRVAGLDAGADDYLPKPYDLDGLLALVRALLRRSSYDDSPDADDDAGDIVVGDLRLEFRGRRVFRNDREIELSKTEFDLLELLATNAGIALDRALIYERIWQYDFGPDSKNLAVYIGYLRRKTESGGEPRIVHTVRGVGYTLRPAAAVAADGPTR